MKTPYSAQRSSFRKPCQTSTIPELDTFFNQSVVSFSLYLQSMGLVRRYSFILRPFSILVIFSSAFPSTNLRLAHLMSLYPILRRVTVLPQLIAPCLIYRQLRLLVFLCLCARLVYHRLGPPRAPVEESSNRHGDHKDGYRNTDTYFSASAEAGFWSCSVCVCGRGRTRCRGRSRGSNIDIVAVECRVFG